MREKLSCARMRTISSVARLVRAVQPNVILLLEVIALTSTAVAVPQGRKTVLIKRMMEDSI
jgi:hypothetical protein